MRSNPSRALLIAIVSAWVVVAARAEDRKDRPALAALTFTGRVEAAEQVGVYSRIAAAVEKVNVDIGDRVKKGQVLIELSAPELQNDVDEAEARLVRAKAEVEQAEAATQAAKARHDRSVAAMGAAEDVYKRAISSPASTPEPVLVEDRDKLQMAKAEVSVANAEIARTEAGVKAAQAGVAVAEAGVRRAQTQLGYTRILAPFDGVVTRRLVDAGATVGPPLPGQTAPLLTVVSADPVHVVFDVDERSAPKVVIGAPAVVRVPSLPDGVFKGKVTRMSAAFNPDTGTLRAEIDLLNNDGQLRPGLSVSVELPTGDAGK